MTRIELSPRAAAALQALAVNAPERFVEADAKLEIVGTHGLAGELLIAVVNHQYDVHALETASPGPWILTISESARPDFVLVEDFLAAFGGGPLEVHHLATRAALAWGVLPSDIYVVP